MDDGQQAHAALSPATTSDDATLAETPAADPAAAAAGAPGPVVPWETGLPASQPGTPAPATSSGDAAAKVPGASAPTGAAALIPHERAGAKPQADASGESGADGGQAAPNATAASGFSSPPKQARGEAAAPFSDANATVNLPAETAKTSRETRDMAELAAKQEAMERAGHRERAKEGTAPAEAVARGTEQRSRVEVSAMGASDGLGSSGITGPAQILIRPEAVATPLATPSGAENRPQTAPVPLAALPVELGLRAMEGGQRFQIRLHPDDLGRVDVKLDIGDDGSVKAHLTVDRVETLGLLQRDARTLERAFEQAGLKTSDGALAFSLGQSGGEGGRRETPREPQGQAAAEPSSDPEAARTAAAVTATLRAMRANARGLDIRI